MPSAKKSTSRPNTSKSVAPDQKLSPSSKAPSEGRGASPPDPSLIARRLTGGQVPLSHRLYPDGSMVIIDHTGRKLRFSKADVIKAAD